MCISHENHVFYTYLSDKQGIFLTYLSCERLDEQKLFVYICTSKSEHNEIRKRREKRNVESYRNQIIAMLDTVQDARLMRTICEVIKAIMMNR